MIDKKKDLKFDGEKILDVLRDIEYMLISLHKIGSYYAPDLPQDKSEYYAETTEFIDGGKVTERLAKIRTILSGAFDETRGVDDLTDIERALEGLEFWKPGSATEPNDVWIFHGANAKFASAVFQDKDAAIRWIEKAGLTGVLTRYPVGIPVHEWAVQRGHHKPQPARDSTPEFIAGFSSAAQEHMHFENGSSD